MTTQLPLTLLLPSTYDKDSFVIGSANEKALGWLERWPDWPLPLKGLNLYGPSGSGKTHLSYLWAGRDEAIALNNLSHFDQEQFLETQHVVLDDFGVSGYLPFIVQPISLKKIIRAKGFFIVFLSILLL